MKSAIHLAASNNDTASMKEILADDAVDVNGLDSGLTPLVVAVAQGALNCVDLLLADKRCDKEFLTYDNMTALHMAAGGMRSEIVARLLLAGCNVNAQDVNGNTPPMIAAEQMMISQDHHATHLKIMIDSGKIDKAITNNDGCSLLHLASYKGRLDMIEYLVEKGWNPKAVDANGNTALHHSVAAWNLRGDPVVAKYLVGAGVDPTIVSSEGETAADVARSNSHDKAVEYLLSLQKN